MKLTALIVVPAILCLCLAAAGCRDDGVSTPTSTDGPGIGDVEEAAGEAEADVVKTMDEYRAEAEDEIDAADAEAELRRLEEEIEADIAAEE